MSSGVCRTLGEQVDILLSRLSHKLPAEDRSKPVPRIHEMAISRRNLVFRFKLDNGSYYDIYADTEEEWWKALAE